MDLLVYMSLAYITVGGKFFNMLLLMLLTGPWGIKISFYVGFNLMEAIFVVGVIVVFVLYPSWAEKYADTKENYYGLCGFAISGMHMTEKLHIGRDSWARLLTNIFFNYRKVDLGVQNKGLMWKMNLCNISWNKVSS